LIFGLARMSEAAETLMGPVTYPVNGHAYYLLTADTWTASEARAVELGGHLATINDLDENQWIANTFGEVGDVSRGLWIGLHDADRNGVFQWASGQQTEYRFWWNGEPVEADGTWNFVHITWPSVTHFGEWRARQDVSHYLGLPICGVVEVEPTGPVVQIFPALEVIWETETGHWYQVQWTEDVSAPDWNSLGEPILGDGSTRSILDSTRGGQRRFYRVLRSRN